MIASEHVQLPLQEAATMLTSCNLHFGQWHPFTRLKHECCCCIRDSPFCNLIGLEATTSHKNAVLGELSDGKVCTTLLMRWEFLDDWLFTRFEQGRVLVLNKSQWVTICNVEIIHILNAWLAGEVKLAVLNAFLFMIKRINCQHGAISQGEAKHRLHFVQNMVK